jgi:RHS repeat-associated protein
MVFTGQEHDENTGLIYFGARYYDPDTARFISQDSYLGEPGIPPSLHRYLYAYSNPTVWIDLFGYANVKYLPKYDYERDRQEDDVTSGFNLLTIEYDNPTDLANGLKEVAKDGIVITVEAYDGMPIKDSMFGVTWPARQVAYWGAFKWVGGNYRLGDFRPKIVEPYNEFNKSSNEYLVAINGILNDENDLRNILEERIEERNIRSGFGVLNPSTMEDPVQSWLGDLGKPGAVANRAIAGFRDVIETIGQKLYLPDIAAEYAAEKIVDYRKRYPEKDLSSIHLHSQGGAIGTSISALYLPENVKAEMEYFSYGSASNPVFGWKSQRHRMNIWDPVPHIAGRGLLFAPVALFDAFRLNVVQDWNINKQNGSGHSWFPHYENSPAR